MMLTTSDVIIAIILISCVPLQYVIVQNLGSSGSTRLYSLKRLSTLWNDFCEEYLSWESWDLWFSYFLNKQTSYGEYGESPAVEVLKYNEKDTFFGMASEPRTYRSPDIKFHVGQVVTHKYFKYKGIIFGWDETARAPANWIAELDLKNKTWKNIPNYAVMVDTRDMLTPHITYVPQDNIKVITNTHIIHPLIEHYFENFDGIRYIPRPWLQEIYPQDK